MNCSNHNIHTASKKVCIRALGRGTHLKSKLHSPNKLTITGNQSMHSLHVWGDKWGQCTVSVLKWVSNIGIFAWATGTLLHLMEKNRN